MLFTGQLRASIIPTVAIPVALVGSLAAVWLLGFSINLDDVAGDGFSCGYRC